MVDILIVDEAKVEQYALSVHFFAAVARSTRP